MFDKLRKFFGVQVPQSSRKDHYYIYPVDKNGKRTGHTICVLVKDSKVFHGVTLCSDKDQFSYETGRKLSRQRAVEAYERHLARL